MKEALLREIAAEYLVPFFAGATLEAGFQPSTAREEKVALLGPLRIAFKVNRQDRYRLVLTRSQSFSSKTPPVLREIDVVRAFVDVVETMESELKGRLKPDLLSTFQRRVVARAIHGQNREEVLLEGIDQLSHWGNRLYEGSPISASIGYRLMGQKHRYKLSDIVEHDFAAVLTNGFDTILTFDFNGRLVGHEALVPGEKLPPFCPMRQAYIAEWTTNHEARVGLTLNRLAEILVLRKQQLIFARRSGRWHFLTHEPVISQMRVPRDRALRTCIYETCLDASFARTGACIGIINYENGDSWKQIVDPADHLRDATSNKAKYLSKIVAGKRFGALDRRTRQELVAIDGATIIDHDGAILAVGAILRIGGGSSGGGRLAAARAISKYGFGLKVSQDGGITGFRASQIEPVFTLM